MSTHVAAQNHPDYQSSAPAPAPAQYSMFNKQKKWKQLQEQAKKEQKESIELLSEKRNSNTSSVNKSGRHSPQSKFIFTEKIQKPHDEKKPVTQIKPILTMEELEKINAITHTHTHTHGRSRSPSISPVSNISISPEPVLYEKYEQITNTTPDSSSNPNSKTNSRKSQRPNSRTNSRTIQRTNSRQKNSHSPIEIPPQLYTPPQKEYHLVPISPELITSRQVSMSPESITLGSISPVSISPTPMTPMTPVSLFEHKYNLQKNIINTVKELVFQHSALICGAFNSQQFVINEYYKAFQSYILSYEVYNNMKFTNQHITNLFMDESVNPESKPRLDLQSFMEILTTVDKMNSFIDSINQCFTNVMCPYKIEHINRGNIKTIIEQSHDLQFYSQNHDGNEIFLHIVKISIPEYLIVFEVRFLILDNEKRKIDKNYIIPLQIPEGLYDAEHLHITNNGHDGYHSNYSSSSIEYNVNNINMKLVSLMPKLNDYDYTKMANYIKKMMPIPSIPTTNENPYNYEFDIFNTIHKKSDFWLSNKNKEEHIPHSCEKCNVEITTNARYVIAKCCHKKYHIECMEMNYYPQCNSIYSYSYLVCDCGCSIIDENSCNSKLLIALYRNY